MVHQDQTLWKVLAAIVAVPLLIGGTCCSWWLARNPYIREGLSRQAACIFMGADKKTTDDFTGLAEEFGVGKPSADFITRARAIGADEYSVYLPGADEHKTKGSSVLTGDKSSWFVSRMEEPGHPADGNLRYEEDLTRLETKFRSLREGSAQIQVTVVPPFLRDYCQIWFKDGKVTKNKVWQLD